MTFFPCFKGISGGFGVLERRIHHLSFSAPENGIFKLPKHYVLKGKWPILKRKNAIKQGKNAKKDKWYPFHACMGGGYSTHAQVIVLIITWGGDRLCFTCLPLAWSQDSQEGQQLTNVLGWHPCRTNLARNICLSFSNFLTINEKCSEILPELVWALLLPAPQFYNV